MANPQLENGFTQIANEILEAVAKLQINGTQFRILAVVWRYTYGFQRKKHTLSEGFIAKATGIHRKQIGRELAELINRNILTEIKPPSFSSSRVLAFNKNYELWQGTKKLTGNELVDQTGSGLVDSPGSGLVDQEIKILNKRNKQIYSHVQEILDHWNSKSIVEHKLTASMEKEITKAIKKYSKEDIVTAINNYSTCYHDQDFYYSHVWRLDKFLKQGNGLPDFLEDGQVWLNYNKQPAAKDDTPLAPYHRPYKPKEPTKSFWDNDYTFKGKRPEDEAEAYNPEVDNLIEETIKKMEQPKNRKERFNNGNEQEIL